MIARTNISRRERDALTLGDFAGVDFSSSPLSVRSTRSPDAVNFYKKDGMLQKRPGWREMFDMTERINGVFPFDEGNVRVMILHAGARFYRVEPQEGGHWQVTDVTESGTHAPSAVKIERLTDERSQGFYFKQKLYVTGCGDYLAYGSWDEGKTWELRRVYDGEDTYVPTTTVGLDGWSVEILQTKDSDASVLDEVNYLTGWRKNKLQGYTTEFVSAGGYEWDAYLNSYTLDASISEEHEIKIECDMTDEYVLIAAPGEATFTLYSVDEEGVRTVVETGVGSITHDTGEISLGVNESSREKYKDFFQYNNGDSIYTVTFYHVPTAEEAMMDEADFTPYEERVTNCRFGVTWGIDGAVDRLFLSGNSELCNIEFFSAADDFTYFGDLSYAAMGSESRAITGFTRLSDGVLAVFKDGKDGDPGVFYQTGKYHESYDEQGNILSVYAIFPQTAGNVGEVVVSRHALADLGGDHLLVSPRGVFGIVLTDNVTTGERYTRERGQTIATRFAAESGKEEAVGHVHDGRYYLCINSHVYVADSRYKTYENGSRDSTHQYEWFYWDGVPARVMFEWDGALGFGTEKGAVCLFDGKYSDRSLHELEAGDIAINTVTHRVHVNTTLPHVPVENDAFTFDGDGYYALLGEGLSVIDGRVSVSEDEIDRYQDGNVVYADTVGESGLCVGVPYEIYDVDRGACTFALLDASGAAVTLTAGGFRLLNNVSGRELYVTGADGESFYLKASRESAALALTDYDGEISALPTARLMLSSPVCAHWCSGYIAPGGTHLAKALHLISVTGEPTIGGKFHFGYETRTAMRVSDTLVSEQPFSLDAIDLRDFIFDGGFAASRTVKVFERSFNFIRFHFYSDEAENCAPAALTAIYKITKTQTGRR